MGRWSELLATPTAGVPPCDLQELLLLKLQASAHAGSETEISLAIRRCRQAGVSALEIRKALLSVALNCVGRIGELIPSKSGGDDFRRAVSLYPQYGSSILNSEIRQENQREDLKRGGQLVVAAEVSGLFVDCGGYDGCSALQFLMHNPHFDCITFEPNPALWSFYRGLPTRLIRKAVFTYNGKIRFTLDPVDHDGSSVVSSKRVDYEQTVSNDDCPYLIVPCINLSSFVRRMKKKYKSVVLKLDIEGAEYDILEKMLEDGTIELIDRLYCEFHVGKMDVSETRHNKLVRRLKERVPVDDWDALPWSFSRKETRSTRVKRKYDLVRAILKNRKETSPRGLARSSSNAKGE